MTLETRTGLMALAITFGIALVCGGGVLIFRGCGDGTGGVKLPDGPKLFGPSADNEGQKWNAKELVDHLNKNGFNLQSPNPNFSSDPSPVPGSTTSEVGTIATRELVTMVKHDLIVIYKYSDNQSAHDAIATWENGVSWGRFALKCSDSALPKVKKALGIK